MAITEEQIFETTDQLAASGRTLARLVVLGAILLAGLGFAADRAHAAYSAQVSNGTLTITGDGASDQLALRLQAGVPTTLQVDVEDNGSADFSFDRATFDSIVVNAGSGDDLVGFDQVNGVFTDTETTTINGEGGNDTLLGGAFAETFDGGAGNQGNDVAFLGAGRDTFVWDPGDGSDIVEGQDGGDLLVFNGSNGSENFDFSANGPRLRFFRSLGNITMNVDGVERVELGARGGADNAVVNDLAGTAVTLVIIDLGVLGLGDGQPDVITINGTPAPDTLRVRNAGDIVDGHRRRGDIVDVGGLAARVRIARSEAANDGLTVNGLGDLDTFEVGPGLAALIQLTVNQ